MNFTPLTQPTQTALPGTTTASNDACPRCGTAVRRILEGGDWAQWPHTVSAHPVTRPVALAAMVTGRTVIVRSRHRRQADTWRRLDRWTLGSKHLAAGDHHLEHVCGNDPPTPPPADFIPDYPPDPPF